MKKKDTLILVLSLILAFCLYDNFLLEKDVEYLKSITAITKDITPDLDCKFSIRAGTTSGCKTEYTFDTETRTMYTKKLDPPVPPVIDTAVPGVHSLAQFLGYCAAIFLSVLFAFSFIVVCFMYALRQEECNLTLCNTCKFYSTK